MAGVPVLASPRFDSLPPETQKLLHEKTKLDHYLYTRVAQRWQHVVAQQASDFGAEVAALKEIQAELTATCAQHRTHPACMWYHLEDPPFLHLVDRQGYAAAVQMGEEDG